MHMKIFALLCFFTAIPVLSFAAEPSPATANTTEVDAVDDRAFCIEKLSISEQQMKSKTFQTLLLECIRREKQARVQEKKGLVVDDENAKLREEGLRRFQKRVKNQGSVSSKRAMRSLSPENRKTLLKNRTMSRKFRSYERGVILERKKQQTGTGSVR